VCYILLMACSWPDRDFRRQVRFKTGSEVSDATGREQLKLLPYTGFIRLGLSAWAPVCPML